MYSHNGIDLVAANTDVLDNWGNIAYGNGVFVAGTEDGLNLLTITIGNEYSLVYEGHNHAASEITSGTLSSSRLPTVPITKGGTGANTAVEALDNLGALNLNYITDDEHMIASGDNLNDYITAGVYTAGTASVTGSLVNGPPYTKSGFRLIVSRNSSPVGVIQFAFHNTTNNYSFYRVQTSSGTWSEWANLMKNVLTPQEYGTSLPAAGTKGRIFFKKA